MKNKRWLTLKCEQTEIYVNPKGYVYNKDNETSKLYILKKKAMEEIQKILTMYNLSNNSMIKNENYMIRYNSGNTKLVFYDKKLFEDINDIILKGSNRKHSTTDIDEDPAQTISPIDPALVIAETPATEKESKEFTYGSKEPTYIWSPDGPIRVN